MKLMQRMISLVLVMVLAMGYIPVPARAAEADAYVDTSHVSMEGTNSFGSLLAEAVNESQEPAETDTTYELGYAVTNLEIANNAAVVTYNTLETAILMVALYSEDGTQLMASANVQVEPDETEACVEFVGDIPEYFLASAYLLDTYDMSPLCAAYDTPMYTREMQELLASTVDDYEPEKILNLDDDDTTNFAVFADNIVLIAPQDNVNIVSAVDEENLIYVIENADDTITSLSIGDIIFYPYTEEASLIVKVSDISVENGTATVYGAELEMEEVFSHIKIETDTGTDTPQTYAMSAAEEDENDVSDSTSGTFRIKINYETEKDKDGGSVRITGDIALTVNETFEFYQAGNLSHIIWVMHDTLEVGISVTGRVAKDLGDFERIPLPFRLPCIKSYLEPKLTFRCDTKLQVNGTIQTTTVVTASLAGCNVNFVDQEAHWDSVDLEGEFTIYFDLNPTLGVEEKILDKSIRLVTVSVSIPLGVRMKYVDATTPLSESGLPDVVHGCEVCFDIPVDFVIKFRVFIKFLDKDRWKIEIPFGNEIVIHMFDMHWSIDNNDFGFDKCPNYLYRITIEVLDADQIPIAGQEVKITTETASDEILITNSRGLVTVYTRSKMIQASAEKDGYSATQKAAISGAQKIQLTLTKQGTSGTGNGKDNWVFGTVDSETIKDQGVVVASGQAGDNITWTLYGSGRLVLKGSGNMWGWNYEQGKYAPWYNYRDQIQKVEIQDGITNIGVMAFLDCSKMTELNIAGSVERIEKDAFDNCSGLPHLVIPEGVTYIGQTAFYGCSGLISIALPSTLKDISYNAFIYSNATGYTDLYYGGTEEQFGQIKYMTQIDGWWLIDANIHYNSSGPEVVASGQAGDKAFWELYDNGHLVFSGSGAMWDATMGNKGAEWKLCSVEIKSVEIKNGITNICNYAFEFEESLNSITIPESVTYIGEGAFYHCTGLTGIVIPDSVISLGEEVFGQCHNLANVTLSDGLTSIGPYVFNSCSALTQITIPNSVVFIGSGAFTSCDNLLSITLPNQLKSIPKETFSNCFKLQKVQIPDTVTSIESEAFHYCEALSEVTIPQNVTRIEDSAFLACVSLEKITLPETIEYIDRNAFWRCDSLKDIYYGGTKEQWDSISVQQSGNSILSEATIHYNYVAAADISVAALEDAPVLYSIFPGEYGTETDGEQQLKTASFTGLMSGKDYVLLSLVSLEVEDPIAPENLLYIDQATAQEDGTLVFKYIQRTPTDVSYVMACGPSDQDLADATITFPEMTADGELQAVNPTVVYEDKTLTEGKDYVVLGSVSFTEAGTYTCYIRGIYDYTGLVECEYKVNASGPVQKPDVVIGNVGLVLKDYIGLQVAVNKNLMNGGTYDKAYYSYVQRNPDGTEAASGNLEFNMAAGNFVGTEFPVLAWSMADTFEITVFYEVDGVVYQGQTITTSVREQAMTRIASTKTDDVTVKTKAVCVAMLNYGANVQDYFNHSDAEAAYLANSELTEEQKKLPTFAELNLSGEVTMPDGALKPATKGLNAKDKINVQFAVKNKDMSGYEVRYTIDGVEQPVITSDKFMNLTAGSNTFSGPTIAMTPRQMRSEIAIGFYDAETGEKVYGDIICSVEAFAKGNQGKATEQLTIAMMVYGDAAEARFGK